MNIKDKINRNVAKLIVRTNHTLVRLIGEQGENDPRVNGTRYIKPRDTGEIYQSDLLYYMYFYANYKYEIENFDDLHQQIKEFAPKDYKRHKFSVINSMRNCRARFMDINATSTPADWEQVKILVKQLERNERKNKINYNPDVFSFINSLITQKTR